MASRTWLICKLDLGGTEFSDVAAEAHTLSCNVQVEMREEANALK